MAHLYVNRKGFEVTRNSYSAGSEFRTCKRKYKLRRLEGWREKENKASREFGKCVESAIQFYHQSEKRTGNAVKEFVRLWQFFANDETLTYTDREGSWADLARMGEEMLTLYEIREPFLPMGQSPRFQLNYVKEVFPNLVFAEDALDLSGIDESDFIDVTTEVPGTHPLLPKLDFPPETRPLVIDIKTSSTTLPDIAGIAALDPQLREYAWISGIRDVAFLWFVKSRSDSFKKGDRVSVLRHENSQGDHRWAGQEVRVLFADDEFVYTAKDADFEAYSQDVAAVKGKALDAKKATWATREDVRGFSPSLLTKCRIQFVAGTVLIDDLKDIGEEIGRTVHGIHEANTADYWPQQPGIRFPDTKCLLCPFLGNCTNNKELRDAKVERTNTDWIEEMEDE